MKVEEFFEKHHQPPFEAVLEPLQEDPLRVRVTPVSQTGACGCAHVFVIDKAQIEDVDPTSRSIMCCGKLRRVVRVTLRAGATMPIVDALATMFARSDNPDDPNDPASCHEEAIWQYKRCVNGCLNSANPDACRDKCRARLALALDGCE